MDIFERMRSGEWIDRLNDAEYSTVAKQEMIRSMQTCFQINHTMPYTSESRALLDELFEGRLPKSSTIMPPTEIDRAKMMEVGENVFINHGFTCMASGGVVIEDGVIIGPEAAIITANHDFTNLDILQFKPVTIKKGAWIGAGDPAAGRHGGRGRGRGLRRGGDEGRCAPHHRRRQSGEVHQERGVVANENHS